MEKSVVIEVECTPEYTDILIAELSEQGYDTFQETSSGFTTYQLLGEYNEVVISEIIGRYNEVTEIRWKHSLVEQQNWNQVWESNYEPITVEESVLVRADFHAPQPSYKHEIVINPRMSFGTGHHETTYLMLSSQLELDHQNKKVMDAGCGTAILAIMAGKLGASTIIAYDNDAWVIDNAEENLKLNGQIAKVHCGVLDKLSIDQDFDIILANINKNVLIGEMRNFAEHMDSGGHLVLSGFYTSDLNDIKHVASEVNLTFKSSKEKNNWCAATFIKST